MTDKEYIDELDGIRRKFAALRNEEYALQEKYVSEMPFKWGDKVLYKPKVGRVQTLYFGNVKLANSLKNNGERAVMKIELYKPRKDGKMSTTLSNVCKTDDINLGNLTKL